MSDIDIEIKRALETEGLAYEPPPSLTERTLTQAKSSSYQRAVLRIRQRPGGPAFRLQRASNKWLAVAVVLGVLSSLYLAGWAKLTNDQEAPVIHARGLGDGERRIGPAQGGPHSKTADPSCEAGNCGGSVTASRPGASAGGIGGGGGSGGGSSASQAQATASSGQAQATASSNPEAAGQGGIGIVRTGEAEIEVKKGGFSRAWRQALTIARTRGGRIETSSAEQLDGRLAQGTLTVRVPAEALDAAVSDFQRLGNPVRVKTASSDVSGQLVDFDARTRAAQARELQLLDLLKQSRSLSDSLQVTAPLSEVRTQIETLQAQKAGLQDRVAMAALSVTIREPQAAIRNTSSQAGRVEQALEKAAEAAASTLSTMVIGIGFVFPFLVPGALIWLWMRLRKQAALR